MFLIEWWEVHHNEKFGNRKMQLTISLQETHILYVVTLCKIVGKNVRISEDLGSTSLFLNWYLIIISIISEIWISVFKDYTPF